MDTTTLLIALLFCVATAAYLARQYFAAASSRNEAVQATVVDHHSTLVNGLSPGARGNLDLFNYSAVYAFSYKDQDYRVNDPMIREKPVPAIGQTVTLIFPPGQPEKAVPRRGWFYALFAVLLTIAALAIAYRLVTG